MNTHTWSSNTNSNRLNWTPENHWAWIKLRQFQKDGVQDTSEFTKHHYVILWFFKDAPATGTAKTIGWFSFSGSRVEQSMVKLWEYSSGNLNELLKAGNYTSELKWYLRKSKEGLKVKKKEKFWNTTRQLIASNRATQAGGG